MAVFRDERLPTLLWAHGEAFRYHGGVCRRIAYDNQTAITLGRVGGRPRWHPSFLAFAQHYGFEPSVGRPGHKERRGKVERPFQYLEEDFLRARTFASWDDLRAQVDGGSTPSPMSASTVRPAAASTRRTRRNGRASSRCPPSRTRRAAETRTVQKDGLIPVDGSYYPVPDRPDDATVTVHIDPVRVQILDAAGGRRHARRPGSADAAAVAARAARRAAADLSRSRRRPRFLARFPDAAAFSTASQHRMTTLTPIHLRALARLADLYGEAAVRDALAVATAYRNFNARAIERILARAHPTVVPEPAVGPLSPRPEALGALDDVDPGSPQDYTLDSMPPTGGPDDDA